MHKKKTMYYLQKYMLTIIGIIIGAAGGYAYYYFVGCASGTCSITSSPVNSTLYGALIGGLLLNTFQKDKKDISTPK
jgi:ABC-type antimicrobial peptide transport system permease subunit